MGSKGGSKYRVIDYFMSIHYGICHGPVDALLGIYIKERDAWPGKTKYDDDSDQGTVEQDPILSFKDFIEWITNGGTTNNTQSVVVEETALTINRPDLFGGEKKEGGVKGTAHYLPGGPNQTLIEGLAAKLGLTTATAPGYRGLASVWFHGGTNKGFMWSQNNPYLPPAWFTVFRKPVGLTAAQATIQRDDLPPDANPAHMIYECLTNTDWGMGAPTTIIDVDSFSNAGVTLIAEKFGLSMIWNQQATIEDFIKEILDHIQATLFVNPRTGLLTLKLIRGDYDPETLRVFDPDNCEATNRQRKAWAETINEINVTWTNPKNEQEETVTFQDLANIAMQGGIVSDSRNYYGVRNATLASELGVRDIRSAGYPLFSTDIEVDRTAWDLLPGDVCKFSWPEDGIDQIVMRVGKIDYGRPGSMTIKASLLEDVFALEQSEYTTPPTTGWTSPDEDPDPFAFTQLFTVPFPALIAAGLDPLTSDDQYPRVVPGILAQQTGSDTYGFELNGPTTLANGQIVVGNLGWKLQTSYSETTVAMAPEAETLMTDVQLGSVIGTDGPQLGGFIMLGEGTDFDMEIAMLDDYNSGTGQWTLARGVMDTIPRTWPVGTPVWYINTDFAAVDMTERVAGATVNYQLQPRTSKGLLPLDQAPVESITLTDRPYRPFRPANVLIGPDGGTWGLYTYTGARPSGIQVWWATRNRLMEDQIVRRWTEGNVTPEVGQTTTIRCYIGGTATLIREYTGLTGTGHVIPYNDLLGHRLVDIEVLSVRDGLESLQNVKRSVFFDFYGYGNNYGNDYAENNGG